MMVTGIAQHHDHFLSPDRYRSGSFRNALESLHTDYLRYGNPKTTIPSRPIPAAHKLMGGARNHGILYWREESSVRYLSP